MRILKEKRCTICKEKKILNHFHKDKKTKDGYYYICKECRKKQYTTKEYRESHKIYEKERNHKLGIYQPLGQNIHSTNYLGIYIAENTLNKVLKNVKRMPTNNSGFDFIFNDIYKVDVKSSCLRYKNNSFSYWKFEIKENIIADYFLCVGFDNRENLKPLKLWLIPGNIINKNKSKCISNSTNILQKWEQYELKNELNKMKKLLKDSKI